MHTYTHTHLHTYFHTHVLSYAHTHVHSYIYIYALTNATYTVTRSDVNKIIRRQSCRPRMLSDN